MVYNQDEIQGVLHSEALNNWTIANASIYRKIKFSDFKEALKAMNSIGEEAEKMNHHPDWRNVYNTLEITLSTHDEGGVTTKDIELAKKIDEILLNF
ncbi:MAG TPA: 4a-hydroxytetrahydrobiopterin dehydratase [Bacteroidia bacterium]